MRAGLMVLTLVLAACGADGDPEPVAGGADVSTEPKIGVVGAF